MPIDHHHPPAIGRIDRGTYGGPFVSGQRTEVVAPSGFAGAGVKFSFRMTDASEPGVAQVLILDGLVVGPNNEISPSGMPSNDTYQLPISGNHYFVYAGITIDQSSGLLTACFLDQAATTPDDSGSIAYITIGVVDIDYSATVPKCTPINFVCGEIFIDVLPTVGLDAAKKWLWGFNFSSGNQAWIDGTLCT